MPYLTPYYHAYLILSFGIISSFQLRRGAHHFVFGVNGRLFGRIMTDHLMLSRQVGLAVTPRPSQLARLVRRIGVVNPVEIRSPRGGSLFGFGRLH